uniref:TNFR-Cys domain-containing protein n=1 Tax=Denticeps clupeoides TaxID=299321 RepID=A0AAY4CAK9_9TELE
MSLWCAYLHTLNGLHSLPYKPDGKCKDTLTEYFFKGLCCKKCQPGFRRQAFCNAESDTVCEPCPVAETAEAYNYADKCISCRKCKKGGVNARCKCQDDMYCMRTEQSSCSECRRMKSCPPGSGVNKPGTENSDVTCQECPTGTFSGEDSSKDTCQPHTQDLHKVTSLVIFHTMQISIACSSCVFEAATLRTFCKLETPLQTQCVNLQDQELLLCEKGHSEESTCTGDSCDVTRHKAQNCSGNDAHINDLQPTSPQVSVSFTATINVNAATVSSPVTLSPSTQPSQPDFHLPLSQEEELHVPFVLEDGKEAHAAIQETGKTVC